MIMKCKRFSDIADSGVGSKVPLRYNGETIGIAIIGKDEITLCVDKNEAEFKRAICNTGLSGFSLEVAGSSK